MIKKWSFPYTLQNKMAVYVWCQKMLHTLLEKSAIQLACSSLLWPRCVLGMSIFIIL